MRRVREPYGDGQAAFGACTRRVVGSGDGVDDGQTEAEAVAAAVTIGRRSLEGLKATLDLVAGDDRP